MVRRRRSRGFVLIALLASAVVVLSIVGLAIDTGRLEMVKIRMQTAADAAALGAVQDAKAGGSAGAVAAARADAAANGFPHARNAIAVSVANPPALGPYSGDPTAVEVNIRQSVRALFMSLAGFSTTDVTARAVARRGPGSACLYALDPSASPAVSASGGAIVQVNCGVIIDSAAGTALAVSGGARLTAAAVRITGGYSASGGAVVSPLPVLGAFPEPDPLAHLSAPAVGPCAYTNLSVSSGHILEISEGVYCGGMSVSGGSRLSLNPGTYVIKGGGLTVSGNSVLTGAGVTIYNTFGGGYSYGPISLSGQATVQLRAPDTGPLAGVLFFQDRNVASGSPSAISGGASSFFNGALYFPTTALSYSGGTGTEYTIIVAKTLSFSGGTVLNSDYTSLPGGAPLRASAVLSE